MRAGVFWVVGLIGRTVIWYNDIEEGFNRSAFDLVKLTEQLPKGKVW